LRRGGATSEERQLALLWLAAAASSVVLRPVWLAIAPYLGRCAFRTWTGVPCPTCGTTRAAVAFLGGNLMDAFLANPLATVAGLVFVAGAPVAVFWVFGGLPVPRFPTPIPRWCRLGIIGVILVNWGYVILTD
jgi:hypothetical protein